MRIGICDDEIEILTILKGQVEEFLIEKNEKYEIMTFESGVHLLECILDFDVIFLDIDMPQMDGFAVAEKINRLNPECKIIMSTGQEHRYKEAFRVDAFRFITKPFFREEIMESVEAIFKAEIGRGTIELYQNRIAYNIQQREIEYICTYDSYSEFLVQENIYRKDISLKELEGLLEAKIFFRINRKTIVNFQHIREQRKDNIRMSEEEFRVARTKRSDFMKAYMEFDLYYR